MTNPARLARNVLLRDGLTGASPLIANLEDLRLAIAATPVEVTDRSSAGQWRELLAGAGTVRVTINARGILHGNAQGHTLATRAIGRTLNDYRIEFDNGDALVGSFQITLFDATGGSEGAQNMRLTLESAGVLTLTAI